MAGFLFKQIRLLFRRDSGLPFVLSFERTIGSMACDHPTKKFRVSVEGNIASGKTTFLEYFKRYSEVQVLQEPVDKWRNVQGHNLLDLMYKDPTRWSLTFQTYVQLTMIKSHLAPQLVPVKLMERSLFSAKYCFVENLYRRQLMPHAEYTVLTEWFDWLIANLDVGIDLIVYLRTTPEVAGERIRRRNRDEEQGVPMEYLQQLHSLHEDWLLHRCLGTLGSAHCQVLVLDANLDASEMHDQYEIHKARILGKCLAPIWPTEQTVSIVSNNNSAKVAAVTNGNRLLNGRQEKLPSELSCAAGS